MLKIGEKQIGLVHRKDEEIQIFPILWEKKDSGIRFMFGFGRVAFVVEPYVKVVKRNGLILSDGEYLEAKEIKVKEFKDLDTKTKIITLSVVVVGVLFAYAIYKHMKKRK